MKKIIAILLTLMMIGGLVGCAQTNSVAKEPTPSKEPTVAKEPAVAEEPKNEQYDIVIVGAGAAGMTAALNAYKTGAKNILLIEKLSVVGGGTTCATGGIHACDTKAMKKLDNKETMVDMFETAVRRGVGVGSTQVYGLYIDAATKYVDWLLDCGYDFWDIHYGDLHKPSDKSLPGAYLVSCLYEQLTKRDIEVRVNTEATHLLINEKGSIKGITVTGPNGEYTVDCTSVILATGGFGSNFDMVVENKPSLKGIHMGNFAGSTGDGIKMAQELGAKTCNMDLYKITNKASPSNIAYSIPSAAIDAGAIYVNKEGLRFVNEGKVDTATLLAQKDAEYFALYNETIYKELEAAQDELGWYDFYPLHYYMQKSDAIIKADTLEELATKMKVDVAALKKTVDGLAKETYESDAAKKGAKKWAKGPYYASLQTVGVNHTLGGLVIDASGRVYNQKNLPIFGLYAGGEVVGNVQGGDYYFGLTDAAVMGGVCGENAVYYVMDHTGLTEHVASKNNSAEAKPAVAGNFTDGVYTGEGAGNSGTIKLEVVVENKSITQVKILEQQETPNIFPAVLDTFIPSIIRTQDLEIDACSGATISCNGVREALKAALNK